MSVKRDTCSCGAVKDGRSAMCASCRKRTGTVLPKWTAERRERMAAWHREQAASGYLFARRGYKQSKESVGKRMASQGFRVCEQPELLPSRGRINWWAKKVKEAGAVCAYCGSSKNLHAHHILCKKPAP